MYTREVLYTPLIVPDFLFVMLGQTASFLLFVVMATTGKVCIYISSALKVLVLGMA